MKITANYVDIEKRQIYPATVCVKDKKITSVTKVHTKCDSYLLPGFIDAHIHIESSMLPPSEFARLAVCHGTVATVSDPHEIANVLGIDGIKFMLSNSNNTPFKFYFGAPSCVPATPFETSGATLGADEVTRLLQMPQIKFLSEVMNFPAVISGDLQMLSKINSAKNLHKRIDGHAPELSGKDLDTYIQAGISTEHEASSYEEGLEKIRKGMKILIREGSAAKNFEALAPLIGEYPESLMFCSDDRHPNDLLKEHINGHVRRAVALGYDLFDILKIACLNPIAHYRLDVGSLHVNDRADFIEVEDLKTFTLLKTVINGQLVAHNAKSLLKSTPLSTPNNFHAQPKEAADFFLPSCGCIEVIQALDHSLLTHEKIDTFPSVKHDVLKLTVTNRYENAKPAIAHVNGFGLQKGAIASSVAHDSHNIIATGCSDNLIMKAVNAVIKHKGGICAVDEENIWMLPLPIAGLMSNCDGFEVARRYEELDQIVKTQLQSPLSAPFMTLSFMALLVIPELKLSDKGLFDSRSFHFISACKEK